MVVVICTKSELQQKVDATVSTLSQKAEQPVLLAGFVGCAAGLDRRQEVVVKSVMNEDAHFHPVSTLNGRV